MRLGGGFFGASGSVTPAIFLGRCERLFSFRELLLLALFSHFLFLLPEYYEKCSRSLRFSSPEKQEQREKGVSLKNKKWCKRFNKTKY